MKVGIALNMLTQEGRPDAAVLADHLALGDLAEPLGFDSLFALEHHFTGYAMIALPNPAPELLRGPDEARHPRHRGDRAAVARSGPDRRGDRAARHPVGRPMPPRVRTGSGERGVCRLPDPHGGSARPLRGNRADRGPGPQPGRLRVGREFFKIPRTSIRPRPISHPERRIYASSVSPESAEIMAKLGFGVLVIMQNEWPKAAEDIGRYREIAQSVGHAPRPPIILTNVSVAESRPEAHERAVKYLSRKFDSIDAHYHFSDGHLGTVKGYESYGATAKTYAKMKDANFRQKAADFYVKIQIVGTPDDCLQQLAELRRLTGLDHLGHRVRLWRHAAPRGRGQYATLRRSRHAVAPARWRIRGSGAGGRGGARRAIRGDLRAGLMMQAAIGIHTTDPIHRPIESPGALTRWARGSSWTSATCRSCR